MVPKPSLRPIRALRHNGILPIFFAYVSISLFFMAAALNIVFRRFVGRRLDIIVSLHFAFWVCVFHTICNIALFIMTGGKRRMTYRILMFRLIPKRKLSRWLGIAVTLKFPVWLRVPAYCIYTIFYRCRLHDIRDPLDSFTCIADFFTRKLRPGARRVPPFGFVSPVDGTVLTFGQVCTDRIVQNPNPRRPDGGLRVKGLEYSISAFLGLTPPNHRTELVSAGKRMLLRVTTLGGRRGSAGKGTDRKLTDEQMNEALNNLRQRPDSSLYYIVLYLNPGDYHRFHSPVPWVARTRKHFPGNLYPVDPHFVRYKNDLYSVNERVVLSGAWEHGFFAYAAVAAYNVGSIFLNCEPDFHTNVKGETRTRNVYEEVAYSHETFEALADVLREDGDDVPDPKDHADLNHAEDGVLFDRGTEIGGFRLGSTIVCIFEAPPDFSFLCRPKQKVLVGDLLGWATDDIPDLEKETWVSGLEDVRDSVGPGAVQEWIDDRLAEINATEVVSE
ncbi:Phosphatidylserine decarboxylase [Carpediemonas membranifera]|uniref:phosphatidylserine decarboxylase n=1 Tax=Carpediemonas membranifera TaxID=201153 RepID=A0A8J6B8E0_9EUKA|nr:Phosphatidylserine decarboxylase [Carpediemonas membranifera]|eukprot:KAG9395294.1 Phosphatidylserine decarboxylase [Carpediemonas membranifera]